VTLAAVVWLTAPLIARVLGQPAIEPLIPWLGLVLPLTALNLVPHAILYRAMRFAPLTARTLAGTLVSSAVAVTLAVAGYGAWSLVGLQLAVPLTEALVLWYAASWRPRAIWSWRHLADVVGFVRWSLPDRAIEAVDNLLPRALVGAALGPQALGLYMLAWKVVELLTLLLTGPAVRVTIAAMARMGSDLPAARLVEPALRGTALVAYPAFLGLAATAPDIVVVAFGDAWLPSAAVLQVLALLGIALPISRVGGAVLYGMGRVAWQAALSAGGLLLLLILVPILLPFGVVAVAAAYPIRSLMMLPAVLALVERGGGLALAPMLPSLLRVLIGAAVMAALVAAARQLAWPQLEPLQAALAGIATGAVTYVVLTLVLARQLLRDLLGFAGAGRGVTAGTTQG
jgi:PST family polysaccharide transporter